MIYLLRNSLLIILLVSCASCDDLVDVDFRPTTFSHDYEKQYIINAKKETIRCDQEEFNTYYSYSSEDIKMFANIIRVAKVPREFKSMQKDLIEIFTIKKEKEKGHD